MEILTIDNAVKLNTLCYFVIYCKQAAVLNSNSYLIKRQKWLAWKSARLPECHSQWGSWPRNIWEATISLFSKQILGCVQCSMIMVKYCQRAIGSQKIYEIYVADVAERWVGTKKVSSRKLYTDIVWKVQIKINSRLKVYCSITSLWRIQRWSSLHRDRTFWCHSVSHSTSAVDISIVHTR